MQIWRWSSVISTHVQAFLSGTLLFLFIVGGMSCQVFAQVTGDLNNDGIQDVIVRFPNSGINSISGGIKIYSGSDATLIGEIDAPITNTLFGFDALAVGDLTGDGISEIAIAAPLNILDLNRIGAVYLYNGSDLSQISYAVADPDEILLWNIAGTKDFDGDGYGDLLVRSLVLSSIDILEENWVVFSGLTGMRIDQGDDPETMWVMLANPIELWSIPEPTADLNKDKVVDSLDAILLMESLGQPVPVGSDGDIVVDGRIDNSDLMALISMSGTVVNPIDAVVEEPPPVPGSGLPSWGVRAGLLLCEVDGPVVGPAGQQLGGGSVFVRSTEGYLLLMPNCNCDCDGDGEFDDDCNDPECNDPNPDPGCGSTRVVSFDYDREVLPNGGSYFIVARVTPIDPQFGVVWRILSGSELISGWNIFDADPSGSTFEYTTISNTSGSLVVEALYDDGCEVRERIFVVKLLDCNPGARIINDQWRIGFNETQILSPGLVPSATAGGIFSWSIVSGMEYLQSITEFEGNLHLTSGGVNGVVSVRLDYFVEADCSSSATKIMTILGDAGDDSDGDGFSDSCEASYGTNPFDSADYPDIPIGLDSDNDGLTDREECNLGTDADDFDSDDDGIPDGDEVNNGSNPLDNDSDDDGIPDSDEDSDGDLLSDHDEIIMGTDPNNPDSDGDGTIDGDEVNQGSDPNDSSDNGEAPPANELVELRLIIGDPSGSHSEKWAMDVGSISLRAPGHGEVIERIFKFRKNRVYPITVIHLGSNRSEPDYDYRAWIQTVNSDDEMTIDDPDGLLAEGQVSGNSNNPADGKEAFLYFKQVDLELDIDLDGSFDSETDNQLEEVSPGRLILVNYDDDNANQVPDSEELSVIDDDELVPMYVVINPPLESPGPADWWSLTFNPSLRVFKDNAKTEEIQSGVQNEFPNPEEVFIESVERSVMAGDLQIALSTSYEFQAGDGDPVTITGDDSVILTGIEIEIHDLKFWRPTTFGNTDLAWNDVFLLDFDFDRDTEESLVDGALTDGTSVCLVRILPILAEAVSGLTVSAFNRENPDVRQSSSVGVLQNINANETEPALPNIPLPVGGAAGIAESVIPNGMAFYVPPASYQDSNFVLPGLALNDKEECRIAFEVSVGGLTLGHHDFWLRRPPIVLMHGLNSAPSTWDTLSWNEDSFKTKIYKIDYQSANDLGYDINWWKIPSKIDVIINEYRGGAFGGKKYAASRVDFVGHSMGGVLGRLFISSLDDVDTGRGLLHSTHKRIAIDRGATLSTQHYHNPSNWGSGAFRRMITIGAPLNGSSWAVSSEVALKAKNAVSGFRQSISNFFNTNNFANDYPAEYENTSDFSFPNAFVDLQPGSAMSNLMDGAVYPTGVDSVDWHPVVGIAFSDVDWTSLKGFAADSLFGLVTAVPLVQLELNGTNSDLVVLQSSQLNGQAVSVGKIFNNTVHAAANQINQMLNGATDFEDETSSELISAHVHKLLSEDNSSNWTGDIGQ